MWFRISGRFEKFHWVGHEMVLVTPAPNVVTIRVGEGPRNEQEPRQATNALVDATYQTDVSPILESEAKRDFTDRLFASFPVEPYNVQGELRAIRTRMANSLTTALNLIRWSVGHQGPAEPLTAVEFSFSLDTRQWTVIHPLPLYRINHNLTHGWTQAWQSDLQEMLDRGEREPIGHDLFRAAWDARVANPRAALFLGVAALEVGTKECISRLVPESTWLVDNLPAPPVTALVGRFIPELLAGRGNLRLFAAPKELVQRIQEAVEHRNTIAHKLPVSQRYKRLEDALEYLWLEETLWTIDDLLWLLDLYCGMSKALAQVRPSTKELIRMRHNQQSLPEPTYDPQPLIS